MSVMGKRAYCGSTLFSCTGAALPFCSQQVDIINSQRCPHPPNPPFTVPYSFCVLSTARSALESAPAGAGSCPARGFAGLSAAPAARACGRSIAPRLASRGTWPGCTAVRSHSERRRGIPRKGGGARSHPDMADAMRSTVALYGTKPFLPPTGIFTCSGSSACSAGRHR